MIAPEAKERPGLKASPLKRQSNHFGEWVSSRDLLNSVVFLVVIIV